MPLRPIKPNQRIKLHAIPGARRLRPNWAVGEKRMVSIPVTLESTETKTLLGKKSQRVKKYAFARSKSARWVIALVQRESQTEFNVLQTCIGTFAEKNPGDRILEALAKEFHLVRAPKRMSVIRTQELG